MKISIRWAMVLGCLGLIWAMQILITSSTYISSQRMLAGHACDVMQNIADLTMTQSKNHLQLAQRAALLTKRLLASEVVGSHNQHYDVLERYFLDQLSLYAHFAGIYIGMPNGDFCYVSRSDAHTPDGFRTKIIDHLNGVKRTRLIWRNSKIDDAIMAWFAPRCLSMATPAASMATRSVAAMMTLPGWTSP